MKIKTKLWLGFGFLFIVVLFFGGVSLFYINQISDSSKIILKDNYESLRYVRSMRSVLDENALPLNKEARLRFSEYLEKEKHNVTERGEKEAVEKLRQTYIQLTDKNLSLEQQVLSSREIHRRLSTIDKLNMDAIEKKNNAAQASVDKAVSYLIFAASICFLLLLSFSVNFPGFVANPLREFSAAIKEIAQKNYTQHLEFKGNDEFSDLAAEFNVMVKQLKKWENSNLAKLQSEKLRIETIIQQMQDPIIGLNEKEEILFLNKTAEQVLNLEADKVVGQNARKLATSNELLDRVLKKSNDDKPIKIYADERESFFQLERKEILVPVYDYQQENAINEGQRAAGEVFLLKNVTQFKELDEAKTNFIATVSHELKTPISSLKMSLKLMNDQRVGELNAEQQELVQHMKEDCGRLLTITSELLDLAQVETGNIQLNIVRSDPRKIAIYAMDAVRFQAEQKSIELELISRNDLPHIQADTEKTAWVMVNFLSNALRYSPAKSKVSIKIIQKGSFIEFSVRDFGKGIDEEYQKRLFDRYFQVPTDGNNKSGSGLGLAISKDFIQAQGGEIWVKSAVGEGSEFGFRIPVQEA